MKQHTAFASNGLCNCSYGRQASTSFLQHNNSTATRLGQHGHLLKVAQKTSCRKRSRITWVCSATGNTHRQHEGGGGDWHNLELSWQYQQHGDEPPKKCANCGGDGWAECPVCHATGALMLGDRMICSVEGGSSCPICNDGLIPCQTCKGSGRIAKWLAPDV